MKNQEPTVSRQKEAKDGNRKGSNNQSYTYSMLSYTIIHQQGPATSDNDDLCVSNRQYQI